MPERPIDGDPSPDPQVDLVDQVDEILPGAWNDEEHVPIGDDDGPPMTDARDEPTDA